MSCWKKYLAWRKRKGIITSSPNGFGEKIRRDSSEPPKFEEADDHLILAEPAGAADPVEELAAGGVLHDDGEVRGREHDLEKRERERTRPPNE